MAGSWGCPHETNDLCSKVNNLPCDPGMKGCVLHGRFVFANEDKNARLVQVNRELLVHYEKKGWLDAVLQREPLTQLKRVEIENIAEEYQDKIDRQEFKKEMAEAGIR